MSMKRSPTPETEKDWGEVTFDAEEAFTTGYIPLDKLQAELKALATAKKEAEVKCINFRANGYCTDAVLKCIASSLNLQGFGANLKEINLLGCSLLTDSGLNWLAQLLNQRTLASPVSIRLDGCTKVTDCGLATLKASCPDSYLSAMATSVAHNRYLATASGCPMLMDASSHSVEKQKKAQVLIVPLKTNTSTARYLPDKSTASRQPLHYVKEATLKDWTVNLLETDPQTPLFEHLVSPNLTQVIIPFSSTCEPADVRNHIADTISLVLSKETINPKHPSHCASPVGTGFVYPNLVHFCHLSDDGLFQSMSDSEHVLGMIVSRQPLSRSNPIYEVECLGETKPEETGLVVGVMHDILMSDRFPMESKERNGGAVERFELEPHAVFGIGVEGEWLSEYVPAESAEFYFTKNGVKVEAKKSKEKPHIGMYPMLSVLGKSQASARIKNFQSPPLELLQEFKKKDQRHYWEFTENMLQDENGVISYCDNYNASGHVGLFVTREGISKTNRSCTIKVISLGRRGTIALGVGPEKYPVGQQPGWKENSIAFHGDDGGVYLKSGSKLEVGSERWKVGDEVKVVVDGFEGDYIRSGDALKISFYLNGKHVKSKQYDLNYTAANGIRCVFLIGMHSTGEKAQLLNYRPMHLPVSPERGQLTMGRSNFINIMDDGTLTYRKFDRREFFGLYMSKTPFSSSLTYFEMEIVKVSVKKHIGIGLCHPHYPINQMMGWRQGSVGYHADNGKLYDNSSTGIAPNKNTEEDTTFKEGDVVGCGIVMQNVKLQPDGSFQPQQKLTVYFTKNGIRTHERPFEYRSEGIYPGVNLHYEGDQVKLRNYYCGPESTMVITDKLKEPEPSEKQKMVFTEGCHFVVVGMSSDGSDPSGKTQLVQQMFDPKSDLSALKRLKAEIERMESKLGALDLQAQQRYGQLLWQRECIQRFTQNPRRISFHSLDTKKGEGHSELVNKIVDILEMDLKYHTGVYALNASVWEYLDKVLDIMKKKEILLSEDLFPLVDHTIFDCNGRICEQAVKFLQKKGYLTCLPRQDSLVALDLEFVVKLTDSVSQCPNKPLQAVVPSLGEMAFVWDDETQIYAKAKDYDPHRISLLRWAIQFFGVMRVPNIRTEPTDPLHLFCTLEALGNAPVTLDDFRNDSASTNNVMVMKRTYHFLHSLTDSLLAFILTRCARATRVVLVRQDGGVFQSGAVQTVVRKRVKGKASTLALESYCYIPVNNCETIHLESQVHIREYTWNIFCILADIIDVALIKLNIPVIVSDDCPAGLVNTSIGCTHDWHSPPADEDDRQTVCTLCNMCCEHSNRCKYKGIACPRLRQSGCGTKVTGCKDCGICKSCADELWTIRSFLRPCCEVSSFEFPRNQRAVQLNSTTFDKVTCTNLDTLVTPLCLRTEGASESYIQVFPGPAVEIPNYERLTVYNKETNFGSKTFKQGDTVTVKLEPLKVLSKDQIEEEEEETVLEIKPVYHTVICRECRVWHDTGIVGFESSSTAVPVSQFVGERALTQECNRFSIEIINEGDSRYIAIGLCPRRYSANRQPGWNSGSVGYHSDDGGIFIGAGWATKKVAKCYKGDVMACELDFTEQKINFFKNDELVYTTSKLRIPAGGFHPFVGMHSVGEAVKLLQKEPWEPKEDETRSLPSAFDCYKYGNLWISPGHKVNLVKVRSKLTGWIMLFNPSRNVVGYKVEPLTMKGNMGSLKPGESFTFFMQINAVEMPDDEKLTVKWLQLDSGREYTEDDLTIILQSATSESLLVHRLTLKVFNTQLTDVTLLTRASDSEPDRNARYKLEVFKNGISVDRYWLKSGSYSCVLPMATFAILTYPKFPTLDRPNTMQRGMRLVAEISKDMYAECVVVSISANGKMVTLEYSPAGEENNSQLELPIDSPKIQLKEIPYETIVRAKPPDMPKDATDGKAPEAAGDAPPETEKQNETEVQAALEILGYSPRGNISSAKHAYMFVPFHLLSESVWNQASQQAIKALDSNWLRNSLQSVAVCSKIPTRLTVQELQIVNVSRKPSTWVNGNNAFRTRIGETFAYLPSGLDFSKLCYPSIPAIFNDIEVHRLCMLSDQKQITGWEEKNIDEPIHFVDIPPIKPSSPLSDELMFGSMLSGWTYTALIAKKLLLPMCDNIFSGGKPSLPRQQLESAMTTLLSVYASLCHIFAEPCGGLEYELAMEEGTQMVNSAITHDDQHTKSTTTSAQVKDPHCLFKRRFYMASKTCYTVVCKAHLFAIEPVLVAEAASVFSLDYFEPYGETINAFDRALHELTALPNNFFAKFQNLQVLILQECDKLKELPPNISTCHQLEKVVIKDSAIATLSADIFQIEDLMVLELHNLPLRALPSSFPTSSWLSKLTLRGLQLREVPSALGNLTELVELDLNYNALTNLPMELSKLQHLRVLHLCGMPWLTMEGSQSSLPLDKYSAWFEEHRYLKTFLEQEKILKLFHDFDTNKNGMLDADEIAALNVHLFWDVPRIGSKDINDEEFGGIPPVIFTLAALEELHLDHQAVTAVPLHMCRLQNLAVLSLANNPLLESLPGSLGHLPSLKTIRLLSCPSLRTPPNEVVSRGVESVKAYLKRLAGGFTECRRTKLMFVGLGGAGKTSLLRALMSGSKKTEGTKNEDITDGILIQPWTVKNDAGVEITYNTWDFAGQTLYYNTHQFFLSKRAVYLLLWSTRQGYEHSLEFWLSSIASHAPKTPIFVVGTHCDQVHKAEVPMTELRERYPQIAGFHFVSSLVGTGIVQLEKDLLKVTLEQKNMGEKVPQVWLSLEKKILASRTSSSLLAWDKIREYGMEVGIYDEKDTKEAIQFLHELGTVQYFDNDFLRSIVVINPQWIVNVMACVVSVKNSPIQESNGRLLHKFIPKIWNEYPKDLHQWLLQLTEEFDLTFPLPKDDVNIVPCLLPQEEPAEVQSLWPSVEGKNVRESKMVYKFAYLPAGLFNRVQVRLFQFSDGKLIWKKGSMLKKNRHHALIKQIGEHELLVKVQGPRPENIIFLVHEVLESLIEESFHGVHYDFLLPCPDCVSKEGTLDPSLFEGSLVNKAKSHRAPFLQCRKYFHTISMAQLQEVMPADSATDFDAHLQHSIMSLQQLNSAMAKDVAILYSSWDIPAAAETDKINPAWVKDDLEKDGEKEGYSCWFPEDVESTSVEDMMMSLKNCKLVVALVSDNFERDKKSNDMLMYTMDTLNKDYIIVVIRPSLNWINTNLGMRIGKDEVMVMIKTKDRYKLKVQDDLLGRVRSKIRGIQSNASKPPVCFLSYSWTNSRDAQSKGSMCPPEALGYGDPREIKRFLESHGITCWLDTEQMATGAGLFQNITQGMRQARVMVACVSDEYVKSDNCMMELRFGVLTLNLPLVICVVGTGRAWKQSEVGILMHRSKASKVYFQQENPTALDALLEHIKQRMPLGDTNKIQEEAVKQQMKELKQKESKQDKTLFNEEYELTQRKFMRHIINYVSSTDSLPMPRLVILDFDKPALTARASRGLAPMDESESSRPVTAAGRPGLRPKTATRTRERIEPVSVSTLDDVENWEAETFCIKLLCECEEGWHMLPMSFPIKLDDEFMPLIRRCSAYLARLYAILQQSSVQLNCFAGKRGKKYREWIEENSTENPNFIEAFSAIRLRLAENKEADTFMDQLCRCHLPSGKTYWLCAKHQDGPRITKLTTESATRDEVRRVLFEEDIMLKELMEASPLYKSRKAQNSMGSSIVLPAKVANAINKTKEKIGKIATQASYKGAPQNGEADTAKATPTPTPSESSKSSKKDLQRQRSTTMKVAGTVADAVASSSQKRDEAKKNGKDEGNGKSKACALM
ncbi:uncharacterized protein [Littorina saxatilis]|uniref:uncharacterized protein n=1 Tax=Littorina saxatilis TaxID=31220 RepID=UPI0038B57060